MARKIAGQESHGDLFCNSEYISKGEEQGLFELRISKRESNFYPRTVNEKSNIPAGQRGNFLSVSVKIL